MASPGISRLPMTRTVKKVEKPRPLKSAHQTKSGVDIRFNTYEEVMKLAELVVSQLQTNGICERADVLHNIVSLASHLKLYGQQLEGIYGDQLDRAFTALRNFANDESFDILTRLRLLELIELRAMHWTTTEDAIAYYQHKLGKAEAEIISSQPIESDVSGMSTPTSSSLPFPFASPNAPFLGSPPGATTPTAVQILSPGEVIKPSGKYALPTKVPGKSYLKDEVVIRNADSGKVSPGAKERLVQITGPSEERIDYARQLIEETIRRNASPSRGDETSVMATTTAATMGSNSSLNSSASDELVRPVRLTDGSRAGLSRRSNTLLHSLSTNDASVGEYKYTVTVGTSALRITGPDLKLVRAAKLMLDEYFSRADWQNMTPGEDFNVIEDFSEPASPIPPEPIPQERAELPLASVPEKQASKPQPAPSKEIKSESKAEKPMAPKKIFYTREFLLNCSKSPLAQQALPNWSSVARQHPTMARKGTGSPNHKRSKSVSGLVCEPGSV